MRTQLPRIPHLAIAGLLATVAAACGRPPVVAVAANAVRGSGDARPDSAPPTAEDVHVVAKLVRDYLSLRPAGTAPNPYWRSDEQERFHQFDVAGRVMYGLPSFRARYGAFRVRVERPPPSAEAGTLEAVVHFAARDSGSAPPAFIRIFARRERGRWKLGAGLLQLTRTWPEARFGAVLFRTQPGLEMDSARAQAAARYVDSLSMVFGVEPPREILYVLARSPMDAFFAMGVSEPMTPFAGIHFGRNRLIISGGGWRDPYAHHELAHAVFYNVERGRLKHRLVSEGAAEWMAWRMDPRQRERWSYTLRTIIGRQPRLGIRDVATPVDTSASRMFYPTGAWLVGRVYDAAGVRGVKELMATRPQSDEVLSTARRHLRMSQRQLDSAWRAWARDPAGASGIAGGR